MSNLEIDETGIYGTASALNTTVSENPISIFFKQSMSGEMIWYKIIDGEVKEQSLRLSSDFEGLYFTLNLVGEQMSAWKFSAQNGSKIWGIWINSDYQYPLSISPDSKYVLIGE